MQWSFILLEMCIGRRPHSPLKGQEQTLIQESCLSWVFSDDADAFLDLTYQWNGTFIPWTSCLHGDGREDMCTIQSPVLCAFVGSCLIGCSSCLYDCVMHVWVHICVRHCHVPGKGMPLARDQCFWIWSFTIMQVPLAPWLEEFEQLSLPSKLCHSFDHGADVSVHFSIC